MRNKENRWMRHLNSNLIQDVLNFDPESVTFYVEYGKYIECAIKTKEGERGYGYAIASVIEPKFNVAKYKNLACGRALKALINQETSEYVRTSFDEFPNTWTKRQIKHLRDIVEKYCIYYKSIYSTN